MYSHGVVYFALFGCTRVIDFEMMTRCQYHLLSLSALVLNYPPLSQTRLSALAQSTLFLRRVSSASVLGGNHSNRYPRFCFSRPISDRL